MTEIISHITLARLGGKPQSMPKYCGIDEVSWHNDHDPYVQMDKD